MKVRTLQGYEGLEALQAYHALLMGLKMIPEYQSESYEDFFARIDPLELNEKERFIRTAALLVKLTREEINAMIYFCEDTNGVRYTAANVKNLKPDELYEIIVAVALAVAAFKINFVSEAEKKN